MSTTTARPRPALDDQPDVMTVPEAARVMGVCSRSVYEAIARGDLPAARIGRCVRIHREALRRFLGAKA